MNHRDIIEAINAMDDEWNAEAGKRMADVTARHDKERLRLQEECGKIGHQTVLNWSETEYYCRVCERSLYDKVDGA